MSVCVVEDGELNSLIRPLLQQGPVMGPKERKQQPGFYYFDWLESAEEVVWDYVTTTLPPKKAFFPPREPFLEFSRSDPDKVRAITDEGPFAIVGVHPCDLAAIEQLDIAYSDDIADGRYLANRARTAAIIGVDCWPDEYCLCTSVGTEQARGPADLFLTPIERGYLVEVRTARGQELLADTAQLPVTDQDQADAARFQDEKERRVTAKFETDVEQFAHILAEGGLTEVWQGVADRCYSCGSCNLVCPTCFCFDINDDINLDLTTGVRVRTWDSCQLPDFAVVAGDHNFRGERWERVRHRWQRKFLYLYTQYGQPFCTGCGRCSRACTADINLVEVSNDLIAYAQREKQNV